ncbi:unnamed protein product [Microthlaspi erraticum]|uniref:NB-ARC domain-containing protein n=1 Tax=Microthlaspi erraticum TaxID=1685480 RepID=A0A6D2IYB5_9BRAS|nr:unnamed protein product [Microthlaspi erraticum]
MNLEALEAMEDLRAKREDLNQGSQQRRRRSAKACYNRDDIWEKVDLEIGVPFPAPENRCKVVFTTRRQDVGKNIRKRSEIPELAKDIARKCGGLPLALNVIGETMSCKKTVEEWRHAINVLTSYATEFSGMEDKILPLLKYSYDNLKDIINGSDGIERAENKGYEIIGDLVRASLLMEEAEKMEQEVVRMHDVVREMALWIASELGREKEAFIVHAGVGLSEIPKVKNWNSVRRMSLMKNKIRNLAGSPECLNSHFSHATGRIDTGIRHLPKGLQELKKLIHLDLAPQVDELYTISGIMKLESTGIAIPVTMNKLVISALRCTISEIKMGSICNKSKTVSPLHNPREPCFLSLSKCIIIAGLRELTLLMFASNLKELDVSVQIN